MLIQIFYKKSIITKQDWAKAYNRIGEVTNAYPTKLLRIESYNGYSPELDKQHFDLFVDKGTENEHISFYGDDMSYTARVTVRFYKNFETHCQKTLGGIEYDETKPITWLPLEAFEGDGYFANTNGLGFEYSPLDTEGARYQYAVLAIGTMLENVFSGKFFMVAEFSEKEIVKVVEWLEGHFNEPFDLPIYADKKRLLASMIDEYEDKKNIVGRFDRLYGRQYKRNMIFAIENIGYEPTFRFYVERLTENYFGTWGFSDILDAWIAATQDLECTLNIISAAKQWHSENLDSEQSQKEIEKYNFENILKNLLREFILWTPQQREELNHFYTNKEYLETGEEDLFDIMRRMVGQRVDVCPIYATEQELFETFMFHEPKKGAIFKQIIEDWITENEESFEQLKQKLSEQITNIEQNEEAEEVDEYAPIWEAKAKEFIEKYQPHEHFFIENAIKANPVLADFEYYLDNFNNMLARIIADEKNQITIQYLKKSSNKEHLKGIRQHLKRLRLSIHTDCETWLEQENNDKVLFYLHLICSLKIYNRPRAYVRHCIMNNKEIWNIWRTNERDGNTD